MPMHYNTSSLHHLKLSRYIVTSNLLSMERGDFNGRLIFSTRTGKILVLDESIWAWLAANQLDSLPIKMLQQFIEAKILVSDSEDELHAVIAENKSAIREHDTLYQVVQPSAWCQLACNYCGQEHSRKQLSEIHQREFLERIAKRLESRQYLHLKIGWFGAEPLAGIGVIRDLSPIARSLAEQFECSYSARIVTNGMALTPKIAEELLEEHSIEEAEITLDGTAEKHDQRRFMKDGRGSFDRIFANLVAVAKATAMRLVIRCNVNRANAEDVAPLIEMLAAHDLASSVRFYTSPVYAWGNDADSTALRKEEYAERELEWLALQYRLGFNVGLIPPRRRIVCMSVQREAEVLDAYGSIFNCTEVPYVPAYGQPNIFQINTPAQYITIHRKQQDSPATKLSTFNEQILTGQQQDCARCAMLPVCGGHCPKAWHEGHEPCPSAKINMPDRLNMLFALGQLSEN